ncbi:hypothetical protein Efla_006408 [Eimeria flavescens]
MGRWCLLVVDAQHDFCEGALAAPQGLQTARKIGGALQGLWVADRAAAAARRREAREACYAGNGTIAASCEELTSQAAVESISLCAKPAEANPQRQSEVTCDFVVFSLDWHPRDHISFEASHSPACMRSICCCGSGKSLSTSAARAASAATDEAKRSLGLDRKWTVVASEGQAGEGPKATVVCLWPPHCVQGTPGAKLHLFISPHVGDYVVRKATLSSEECFSACGTESHSTGLLRLLQSKGVQTVAICGFCLDYCVAATAVPLSIAGVPEVVVLTDLTAAIHVEKQQQTVQYLETHGVRCMPYAHFIREQVAGATSKHE